MNQISVCPAFHAGHYSASHSQRANHFPDILRWNSHYHIHDRLHHDRTSLQTDFVETLSGGGLKGEFSGHQFRILDIDKLYLHVADFITELNAALHRASHSTFHSLEELSRHSLGTDRVHVLETSLRSQRRHPQGDSGIVLLLSYDLAEGEGILLLQRDALSV